VERYLHPKTHGSTPAGSTLDEEIDFGAGAEAALPSQPSAGVTAAGQWEEAFVLLNNYLHVATGFDLLSHWSAVFQQQ